VLELDYDLKYIWPKGKKKPLIFSGAKAF